MKRIFAGTGLIAVALLTGQTQALAAQELTRMGGFVLSAWAGGAANSDLQRTRARADWLGIDGRPNTRFFERRLTAATSMSYGAGLAYWVDQWWGVRLRGSVAPSHLQIAVSERETAGIPFDTAVTGPNRYNSIRVWTYDAQLLVRLPISPGRRVAPFGFLGAGRVEYESTEAGRLPPEAAVTFVRDPRPARFAGVAGLGAAVPLQWENLALSFELSVHALRTPVERVFGSRLLGENIEVTTSSVSPSSEPVTLTTHVQLLIGCSWFFR